MVFWVSLVVAGRLFIGTCRKIPRSLAFHGGTAYVAARDLPDSDDEDSNVLTNAPQMSEGH